MFLVTQVALHALTGTAIDPALPVAFQMSPHIRARLMLGSSQVADLIDMADAIVVLIRIPIHMLQMTVVLPVTTVIAVLITHVTVTPVITVLITHVTVTPVITVVVVPTPVIPMIPVITVVVVPTPMIPVITIVVVPTPVIPVITIVVVPAVPLVVLTPVVPVLPAAPVVIAAVVVVAPLTVVVMGPVGRVVPARRRGPAVGRFPTLRYHPADFTDPNRTEVVGTGHPQVRIVQEATEIVPDVVEHLGSQPVLAKRTLRHCMLLRTS
jgi:hypothetical protein